MTHNVQTFRAASMPAALELVRRELGRDAVILGTRSVPAPGIGRLVGRDRVEITAAPSGTTACGPQAVRQPGRPPAPEQTSLAPSAARSQPEPGRLRGLPEQPASLSHPPVPPALPEQVHPYYVQLVQNEVAEELAARVLRAAARAVPAKVLAEDRTVREVLRRCIAQMVPTAEPVEPASGSPRRVALVGPPGGGKTTTLAKIAAQSKLRAGKRVGLLSLDMHRLAANEQLRRYADIIRVPLECVQTVAGVHEALRRLGDVEHLLIDTPGVGPREQGRFARLGALLRAARPDEVHLVLPAYLTEGAQTRVAQAFAPLGVSRVALTHLDEAVGFGVILNAVDRLKLDLSYLTSGQNVPRDLEKACSRRVAELILPLRS